MRRLPLVALFTLALALLPGVPAAPVAAQDCALTVPAGGDIQRAVDGSTPGATVCLEPGVYFGTLTLESRSGLTIRGAGMGKTFLVSGDRDVMLVFRSSGITVRGLTMAFGLPSAAYVFRSTGVVFEDVEFVGSGIGVHYDVSSTGRLSNSVARFNQGDGVLIRNHSSVAIDGTWSVYNGGVGVSSVGATGNTTLTRSIIAFNEGPGVFAGVTPCAELPPGQLEAPSCYFEDLPAYVGKGNLIMNVNLVLGNESTGVVLFPGTRVRMRGNTISSNLLTGVFVWAAILQSQGDVFIGNEEHAVEIRAYPDPLSFGEVPAPFPWRPAGIINNARITAQVRLDGVTLGGGVLSQGGNLLLMNSVIADNAGIGVSYVNRAVGSIDSNTITGNGGSAICLFKEDRVDVSGNRMSGNLDDRAGVCRSR